MSKPDYTDLGASYNNTRKADPFIAERLQTLAEMHAGGHYLDLGCGTGNYAMHFTEKGFRMVGVDPSETMLQQARANGSDLDWRLGSAESIPAEEGEFDGAIAMLTTHHWTDVQQGLKELRRVVKPGGRIVIFTSTPEQMKGYWLNHYFPTMMQLAMLQMSTKLSLHNLIKSAGMSVIGQENYTVTANLQDHFLYVGKHNPELYFDEKIRKGISSFSMAAAEELESGLTQLSDDIDRGQFWKFKQRYENRGGDYMFMVCG
ncbi:MAG: methyltransferase domain-containing protein [Cryomorphaceae bacterium]|nr:methyltransferase domain-containing protein [Cryomorphaceae bacterium]